MVCKPHPAGGRRHGTAMGPSLGVSRQSDVDLLIAATALEHGLTVVTRNVRHFAPTGVPVLDPFGEADTSA